MGIYLLDAAAKPQRLATLADGDDDLLLLACERALRALGGCAVVELLEDEIVNLGGLGGDDGERLAEVDRVENIVDDEHLGEQTEQRIESDLGTAVDEEGRCRDKKVGDEKRLAYVQRGVFF